MTIDYTSDAGRVRLLVPDVDEDDLLFTDDQITAFLALGGQNVHLAAAEAVETVARNEALLLKVLRVEGQGGVSTDGAKLATELRQHARQLRERSDQANTDGGFEVAEQVQAPFQAVDIITGREGW